MNNNYKYSNFKQQKINYKIEELLNTASNRYKVTIQVANRAKRRKYEDIDIIDDTLNKPILRAILEMVDEMTQPEILSD